MPPPPRAALWAVVVAAACWSAPAAAQPVPVPALSSNQGAAYTLYLNFGGFSFNGVWGADAGSPNTTTGGNDVPGFTPAYTIDADPLSFNAAELAGIRSIWSRAAEKYAPFGVNVTTLDPSRAVLGAGASDAARQLYYDQTPRLMQTVIGGTGAWAGGGGGVSFIDVIRYESVTDPAESNGFHTNWVFSAASASSAANLVFVGEAAAHENGHAFGAFHLSTGSGAGFVEYYAGTGAGPGSVAPVMGDSYTAERGTWAAGRYSTNRGATYTPQDDVRVFLGNPGLAVTDDGVGRSASAATPLLFRGDTIRWDAARGVIVPADPADPTEAATAANSTPAAGTSGYFRFTTTGGAVSITVNAGRDAVTPGTPDPGATLNAALQLLDAGGTVLHTRDTASLSETLSLAFLPAGDYTLRVYAPAAGPDAAGVTFYNLGSYFVTGTVGGAVSPVPEPGTVLGVAALGLGLAGRVRRRRAG